MKGCFLSQGLLSHPSCRLPILGGGGSPKIPPEAQPVVLGGKVLTPVLALGKGCCEFYSIHRFATPKEMSSLSLLDHLFTSQSLGIEGKSSMCTVKVAAKHLIIGLERKS